MVCLIFLEYRAALMSCVQLQEDSRASSIWISEIETPTGSLLL